MSVLLVVAFAANVWVSSAALVNFMLFLNPLKTSYISFWTFWKRISLFLASMILVTSKSNNPLKISLWKWHSKTIINCDLIFIFKSSYSLTREQKKKKKNLNLFLCDTKTEIKRVKVLSNSFIFHEIWILPNSQIVNTMFWTYPTETKLDLSIKAASNSVPDIL